MTIITPNDLSLSEYILRTTPKIHFETCIQIYNRANELIYPQCNILQQEMSDVYVECMKRGIPCRMLILKPRQVGCSTFAAEILYLHCYNYLTRAVQIADELAHSDNIFNILCRHAQNDAYPWSKRPKITASKIVFPNGSIVEKDTAQNPRAGISATRQAIHASEVAKWPSTGIRSAYEVMGAMLNSLADIPGSIAIAESTPNGASGWFYEQWKTSVSLKDFLAGKKGNGWIKVFAPWFAFQEHQLNTCDEEDIENTLDERENRGKKLYLWTPAQIAWRRRIRDEKCSANNHIFDEYYPEDDLTCFISSGSPKFDIETLQNLESLANQTSPDEGQLQENDEEKIIFEKTSPKKAWAQIWEKPLDGCRYIIAADLSVGIDQSSGENANPDRHSVLVLKEAHINKASVEYPHTLVARIKPPSRVGFDLLAQQTDLLSKFYGHCVVAPEMNNSGMAYIERLKERNVPIYKRKKNKILLEGWQTTSSTRKLIIDELDTQLREGLDIRCPHLISELKTFVNHPSGKEQAMPSCHDDDVMALAIGLHCISSGTIYRQHNPVKEDPCDSYEPLTFKKSSFKGNW